jgi:sulfonate transport system substrate-binding protein
MKKNGFATRLLSMGIIFTFVLGSITGCGNNAKSGSTNELNTKKEINIGTNNNYFTATVAYEKGFLQDEFGDEYTFTLNNFTTGPEQIEAIAAGKLDIAQYGDVPTTNSYANNAGVRVISSLWSSDDAYALLAGKDSNITSIEELKGKKIAIGIGTNPHELLLKMLEKAGLSENDIDIVNMSGGSDQLSALIAGTVDAIIIAQPNFDTYMEKSGGTIVATNKDYNLAATFILATDDFAENNPDTLSRILKVFDETNTWIYDNVDEAAQIVADYFGEDKEDALKYLNTREFAIGWNDDLTATFQATVEYEYSQGLINNKFNVEDAIDTSYLEAAGLYAK